ncbi:MAG: phosphopantothenoylcysteine decarboxylase [Ethanoligenens sp.]
MEWIITAGATSEDIDTVRSITNHATGALGCSIAEKLANKGGSQVSKIYYICEPSAKKPDLPCVEIRLVHGAVETARVLQKLLCTRPIAAVVHSMAVSDYTVQAAADIEQLAAALEIGLQQGILPTKESLSAFLQESLTDGIAFSRQGKLSSNVDQLLLLLQKTPKIIGMIKEISPQTQLVGFKLLDDVSYAQLIDTAYALLEKNACDYVLANDLKDIRAGLHTGYLVERDRTVTKAAGKAAIAELIVDRLLFSACQER